MFPSWKVMIGLLSLALIAMGCGKETAPSTTNSSPAEHDHADDSHDHQSDAKPQANEATEKKVSATLAKLKPEDRQLAESQKFCAVMTHERLGGMGTPLKLDIKGEPVFVCCKGCRTKALKNPDETLARVADLKSKNALTQP